MKRTQFSSFRDRITRDRDTVGHRSGSRSRRLHADAQLFRSLFPIVHFDHADTGFAQRLACRFPVR